MTAECSRKDAMNKKDDIDTILRLLPFDPNLSLEGARGRLAEQSEDELRKMRLALESCVPAEGQADQRWEAAVSAASDLSGLEPLLKEWAAANETAASHLHALRSQA